jgi:spore maturation protein CgeB
MDASFLRECRSHVRFIVGQIASVILPTVDLRAYDLLISSFPHYVKRFREMGLSSEYLKIAFETRVLERLSASNKTYDNTFVGGLSRSHTDRINLLEHLSLLGLVDIWGYGVESLDSHSAIRSRYHSEAWGLEMYQLLANSRIALNQHINVAGRFANNQRLYEATGVGALLLTDEKDNLQELFVPGEEVITYGSIDDCREKIEYYIAHSDESTAIAQAGQKRTLSENTYYHRMQELSEILSKYMVKV